MDEFCSHLPQFHESDNAKSPMLKHQHSGSTLVGDTKRRCIGRHESKPKLVNKTKKFSRISIKELTKTTTELSEINASIERRRRNEQLGDDFGHDRIEGHDVCFGMVGY